MRHEDVDTGPSNVLHLRFVCPSSPTTARSSKSAATLGILRARLSDGTWPIGTRLPGEHDLATELGVGRNTLREALRTLTHQGLLTARAGDGTYVLATDELAAALAKRFSAEESRQALEVRCALEMQAARIAAQRIGAADLHQLEDLTRARKEAAEGSDDAAYVRADLAWHEFIVNCCDNPLLSDLYTGLDRAAAYSRAPDSTASPRLHRPAEAMDLAHQRVLDALKAHDPDAATQAAAQLTDIATTHLLEATL
ncbi:MAG: FadR/GntR family transcriptional regulator [Galactobacter sp.]